MISNKRIKELQKKIDVLKIKVKNKKFILNAAEGYFLVNTSSNPIIRNPIKNIIDGYDIYNLNEYSMNRIVIANCIKDIVIIAVKSTNKRTEVG
ncbi:hypothetical protein [uncultured Clostridium sp.]|uniref:hypothetical protein n=1 Tax=uncultured Clostridium sp. TaxID=59620 RepID=UPI00258DB653|nr:hypothetical protein [uncultured Clostridium sp.]